MKSWQQLGEVELVEVVGSKGSSALGALSETGVVTTADALGAEDMEALGEDRVLLSGTAARAVQLGLQGEGVWLPP